MSTEISTKTNKSEPLVPKTQRDDILAVDGVLAECRAEMRSFEDQDTMVAFVQAKAINRLRKLITPAMMSDILALANTPLGFRTDRPPGKGKQYSQEEIKECVIVALLSGCRLVNNEFNIIGGNCYITKNGLARAVAEFPGLTDLKLQAGVPNTATSGGGALVPYRASWKLHGVPDEIVCTQTANEDTRIPVRINEGMGADAILGKARRKMLAKILERLTGTAIATTEESTDVEEQPEDVKLLEEEDVLEFESEVAGLESKAEVDAAVARYIFSPGFERIETIGAARIAEIHNSRGERSNN